MSVETQEVEVRISKTATAQSVGGTKSAASEALKRLIGEACSECSQGTELESARHTTVT
jgi:hypothetical protein